MRAPDSINKAPRLIWSVFAALLLLTLFSDMHHAVYLFRYMTGTANAVAQPIRIEPGTARVREVDAEAQAAGIRPGDTVAAINNLPYDGSATLGHFLQDARVADSLTFSVVHSGEPAPATVRVSLVPRGRPPSDRSSILLLVLVALPLACQLLGFLTVSRRPWSRTAWLMLAVSLAFANIVKLGTENRDGTVLSTFGLAWNLSLGGTVAVWLLLLTLHFPDRVGRGRRWLWAAWSIIALLFALSFFRTLAVVLDLENFRAASRIQPFIPQADLAWRLLTLVAVGISFALMIARLIRGSNADVKRRMRLFICGTAAALLPLLGLLITAQQAHRALDSYPVILLLPALSLTLLFPVTLAFVITIPRAPELSGLFRQSIHRALSQKGLIVVHIVTVGIYLIAVAVLAHPSPALLISTLVFAIVLLTLNRSVVEPFISWSDRTFFKEILKDEKQLEQLSELFTALGDLEQMLSRAEDRFCQALAADAVYIIVKGRQQDPVATEAVQLLAPDSVLGARLAAEKNTQLVYFDLPDCWVQGLPIDEQVQLRRLQTRVVVGVPASDGLVGIISLGPKRFDIPYSRTELALIRLAAVQVGLAIENSSLVERISEEASERERIKAEKDATLKASEAKSAFLASMSHELRTPLTAIIGYAELLLEQAEERDDASTLADLKTIHFAGKHLLELINSVLDISKIEAGKMEVYSEPFSIAEAVENVISVTKPLVQHRNNQVLLKCDANLGYMYSDRTKIRQALFNLISNASKFTENGTIVVRVSRQATDARNCVVFAVSDTGIGIRREEMGKLFQPFSQVGDSTERKYGGTGLGLSITKKFCEMLGGEVSVVSEIGHGSTFTMRLPLRLGEVQQPELDLEESAQQSGPLVLVIDDDAAVHQFIRRSLEKRKIRVITASDGERGLALAKRHRPQAIVLDIIMKGLDGWQVLSRLKSDPEVAAIPVLVVTVLESRSAAYALGAADYLVKPFDRDRLLNLISAYCGAEESEHLGCVLIVDDDPNSRSVLRRSIEGSGRRVVEAQEGKEALAVISQESPDLILLDLNMPGMDGFQFMEELDKQSGTSHIPVVVVTSRDLTHEERSRLLGRVSHIMEKGNQTPEQLIEAVHELLTAYLATVEGV